MNKKAQGLSVNVIIIVAIALIVLVVLVAVFTGSLGNFTTTVKEQQGDSSKLCSENGGSFNSPDECTGRIMTSSDSGPPGTVCCK
jgi:flagellar basal body-associated protein FliL